MKTKILRLFRRLTGNWWEVRRCCWPYPEGYATYNPATRTILDTGLTKQGAQAICDGLNGITAPKRGKKGSK